MAFPPREYEKDPARLRLQLNGSFGNARRAEGTNATLKNEEDAAHPLTAQLLRYLSLSALWKGGISA
jgi:hypothetical protein